MKYILALAVERGEIDKGYHAEISSKLNEDIAHKEKAREAREKASRSRLFFY